VEPEPERIPKLVKKGENYSKFFVEKLSFYGLDMELEPEPEP
jgi:hypothetical protein